MRFVCLLALVFCGCSPAMTSPTPAEQREQLEQTIKAPPRPEPTSAQHPEGSAVVEPFPNDTTVCELVTIYKAEDEYTEERHVPTGDRHSVELGEKFPRIIIDGVKCEWDAERKSYVDSVYRCKVIWLEVNGDRQLMSHCDFRAGTDGQLHDGDVQIVFKPLQIRDGDSWRDLREGDPIHDSAAKSLGIPVPALKGDHVRIGKSLLWAEHDGKVWRLVSSK